MNILKTGSAPDKVFKRSVLAPLREAGALDENLGTENVIFSSASGIIRAGVSVSACVNRAANELFAYGVRPEAFSVSILVPEGTVEDELSRIAFLAGEAGASLKMKCCCASAEISDMVKSPFMSVTCFGRREGADAGETTARGNADAGQKPGDFRGLKIIMAGTAAVETTALLGELFFDELSERFSKSFLSDLDEFKDRFSIGGIMETARGTAVCADEVSAGVGESAACAEGISAGVGESAGCAVIDAIPVGSGGVFDSLRRFGERHACGLNADIKKIPICQITVELCELHDINPYNSASLGAVLLAAEDEKEILKRLRGKGIPAEVIGCFTRGNDMTVTNGELKRHLESPGRDDINKIKSSRIHRA